MKKSSENNPDDQDSSSVDIARDLNVSLGEMTVHPIAALFPMIDDVRMDDLVESIKNFGLLHPLLRQGNVLLDGRNRLVACYRAKVEPRFVEFSGDMPGRHIYESNMRRRHMTEEQYLAIGAKAIATLRSEADARMKHTQFKPGMSPNPAGRRGKEQADTISYPPDKPDTKEKNERSTIGQLAELVRVSHHKAAQMVKVVKAEEKGELPSGTVDKIAAGNLPLGDAVKQIMKIKPPEPKEEKKSLTKRCEDAWKCFRNRFTDEEFTEVKNWLKSQLI